MNESDQLQPIDQSSPDPELVKLFKQFFENQTQELTLRQQQLDLSKAQLEKSYEYAQEALKADFEDRDKERHHELKLQRNAQLFLSVVILGILLFLLLAFLIDKEIAKELIRIISYIAVAVVTYLIGRYQKGRSSDD